MNVIRTLSGLVLPIRCINVGPIGNPIYFGSCSYNDICKDFFQNFIGMTTQTCQPELADWGIDCNCPFDILAQSFDSILHLNIPNLSATDYSFLASGDFDVTTTINNSANQHVACLRVKFTLYKGF